MHIVNRARGMSALVLGAGVALALTGCQTATEREVHALLQACSAGDQQACNAVPLYQAQEEFERRRRVDAIRAMSAGAALGGRIGGQLAGGPITPPPAAAPLAPPVHCTALAMGPGMTTLDCP